MKNIIQFLISEEDGFYTAQGVNVPIVTEAKNFEDLKKNIKEAVELFFQDEDLTSLGFGSFPSVLTSFELSLNLNRVKS